MKKFLLSILFALTLFFLKTQSSYAQSCQCSPGTFCQIISPCPQGYTESCGSDGFCSISTDCVCIANTPTPLPPNTCACTYNGFQCLYAGDTCNYGHTSCANPPNCTCSCLSAPTSTPIPTTNPGSCNCDINCNPKTGDTCIPGYTPSCNSFSCFCTCVASASPSPSPNPYGTCTCVVGVGCNIDSNSCDSGSGYTPQCFSPSYCSSPRDCQCVYNPGTYTCTWQGGAGGDCITASNNCNVDAGCHPNCGSLSQSQCSSGQTYTCVCEGPTPTSSAPPDCASRCPPGSYPSYEYPQCFIDNQPDLPTPGVWDCYNTRGDCTDPNYAQGDCYCCLHPVLTPPAGTTARPSLYPLCPNNSQGIQTAIGCIPVGNQNEFLAFVLRWVLGIAGGVAFILIVFGGFLYLTSGGDKQKVTAARQLLTAAISGLLLIIFSVFLLDLLGVRLLQLPGLSE